MTVLELLNLINEYIDNTAVITFDKNGTLNVDVSTYPRNAILALEKALDKKSSLTAYGNGYGNNSYFIRNSKGFVVNLKNILTL